MKKTFRLEKSVPLNLNKFKQFKQDLEEIYDNIVEGIRR